MRFGRRAPGRCGISKVGSGIASRTIASMDIARDKAGDLLTPRDVLVIDEVGIVGTRQLERRCRRMLQKLARRSCWSAYQAVAIDRSRRGFSVDP